ncbi:MAG: cytochrome c-type biogenesis protein CcmH [Alphaproteobacteria bacterium]|nr:cytochrome c-type biogenesis protein CcmH [Alphaproteobacteria bacterium]
MLLRTFFSSCHDAKRIWRAFAALLLTLALLTPALAVEPDEVMKDPALEARARELSKELRCLVCQNQSIDDSAATLARDLRLLVRERIAAGDSDRQVLDYLTSRYGSFVLLKPPMKPATYLLWFGPALVLVLGGAGLFVLSRRRAAATAATAPLSEDERLRLAALLDDAEAPPAAASPAAPVSRPRKAKGRA